MIYKKTILLWLTLFLFTGGLKAQTYSERIVKKFNVKSSSSVEVTNKYGKIHVITWNKDSVKVIIDFRIKTNNEKKMAKYKDNIKFDFVKTDNYLIAKTLIRNSKGAFSEFVDQFIPSNQVTINYLVYMPKNATAKIENKFGDVYLDDFYGNLTLILSNGNLKANDLSGQTSLRLSSADGVINTVNRGKLYVSYSDLHIRNSTRLNIESRSSRVNLGEGKYLKINSRRDKYYISKASEIYGDSYFSDFTIHYLTKEINYSLRYGDITFDKISKRFSFINLISEYTDIGMIFEKGVSYDLDITHHADVHLNYPQDITKLQSKKIDQENNQIMKFGRVGSDVDAKAKVKIHAPKKCIINIEHK